MGTDERSRHELLESLDAVLGKEAANTLMAHLPPTGWADVATKRDLDLVRVATQGDMVALGAELRVEMAGLREELRGEMAGLREELRGEMAGLREDVRGEMAGLREDVRGEMAGLRSDLARTHQRMMMWFAGVMVSTNTALVGLVVALG